MPAHLLLGGCLGLLLGLVLRAGVAAIVILRVGLLLLLGDLLGSESGQVLTSNVVLDLLLVLGLDVRPARLESAVRLDLLGAGASTGQGIEDAGSVIPIGHITIAERAG